MVLSEAEAEARLADLRRQREAIDRAITDLTLYLELGRRLGSGAAGSPPAGTDGAQVPPERRAGEPRARAVEVDAGSARERTTQQELGGVTRPNGVGRGADDVDPGPVDPARPPGTLPDGRPSRAGPDADPGGVGEPLDRAASRTVAVDGPSAPAGQPEESADALLSEGVLARRYGRALIQAALAVLEEAGRPMHAGEIEAALSARGFSVPGQHDPIAALNTRLWKRSGPGGPLRRLGDAVYALPERDEHGRG